MMFVSMPGHAIRQTAGISGPSMIDRSYLRAAEGRGPGGVAGGGDAFGARWCAAGRETSVKESWD